MSPLQIEDAQSHLHTVGAPAVMYKTEGFLIARGVSR
jgi:hypothetical protein